MSEEVQHPTPAQILTAFARAPVILEELCGLGAHLPSFELYEDASGTLWLGQNANNAVLKRAPELVKSVRWVSRDHNAEIGIRFCGGLMDT